LKGVCNLLRELINDASFAEESAYASLLIDRSVIATFIGASSQNPLFE
jgi:hypothetical protein